MHEQVEAALEELQPLVDKVGASVREDVDASARVQMAGPLLHMVLINLLGNALKFLENRATREVRVSALCAPHGTCTLVVEDTGPGIPAESLARLFEPFYRVPGVRVPGTGLGLATVDRLVRAHGGRVRVSSEVGRGTRISVELPRPVERAVTPPNEHAIDAASAS